MPVCPVIPLAATFVAVVAFPLSAAVIVPALKFPEASLVTIAFAVLVLLAVVAELLTFPDVDMVESFVSAIEPDSIAFVTVPESPVVTMVPVTSGIVMVLAPESVAKLKVA
jgi:hypothetical protein